MIHFFVISEGLSEETFVNEALGPWLHPYGTYVTPINIKGLGGGPHYQKLKNDIDRLRCSQPRMEVRITTFIDLYELPSDFPGYDEIQAWETQTAQSMNPYEKVQRLEKAFALDIQDERFVPYIQLHEFETFFFVQPQILKYGLPELRDGDVQRLIEIRHGVPNPEWINQGVATAPSKRLLEIIPSYEHAKGRLCGDLATMVGIETLRAECPHFKEWTDLLSSAVGIEGVRSSE